MESTLLLWLHFNLFDSNTYAFSEPIYTTHSLPAKLHTARS